MNASEEWCAWEFVFIAVAWSVLSAVAIYASINEDAKGLAWGWTVSFAAASFVSTYCFWRLW